MSDKNQNIDNDTLDRSIMVNTIIDQFKYNYIHTI
jgi:hypothetical protein